MSFIADLFSGLTGFRDHLVNSAEQAAAPVLKAVEAHLARLEPLVRNNVLAAEDEGRAILHELYGSVVGEVKAEVADATAPSAEAAADPTPAPSTTAEDSSAPSSTPSDSTTETAAPAEAPAAQ